MNTTNRLDRLLDSILPGPQPLYDRLSAHRRQKLKRTLRWAQKTKNYQERAGDGLAKALSILSGQDREEFNSQRDENLIYKAIEELPFTYPSDLALRPDEFLAVSQDDVEGVVSIPTSGSSGLIKRIYSTASDLENIIQFFQYGMLHLVEPGRGDKVSLMMPGRRPGTVGHLLTAALDRWGIACHVADFIPPDISEAQRWFEELIRREPTCLVGLPSQIFYLGRLFPKIPTVKSLLLSGEPAPESIRQALTDDWGSEVFLHYGLTEFGLGGAVECREHKGPHLREADLLAEIVDTNGRRLNDGEEGELTITSLSRRAMPIIRYRTGDRACLINKLCPCGSVLRRLLVKSRMADDLTFEDQGYLTFSQLSHEVYELPFLTAFSASYRQRPQKILTLNLGLSPAWLGRSDEAE
ncbi:MAG: AMP-binding protein, partial [Deltaproteobacteria bacterium]|nr:AMP-binding protein [Deltaproteobacteria bacterium]